MILEICPKAVSCRNQLEEFNKTKSILHSEIIKFDGVGKANVYNPSVPFELNGETIIAGRVEMRNSEESKTVFFVGRKGVWVPRDDTPSFDLQDPFVVQIGNELVFGGVRVIWENKRITNWVTDFYRGKDLEDLQLFATGPEYMKDIRLISLSDGRIALFTRPQGEKVAKKYGCIAKIGFTIVDSLDKVNSEVIENAPILEGHFLPDEWGGCNQLHFLENGLIGIVGHKAYGEGNNDCKTLHYYAMTFAIDPDTKKMTPCKIICSRNCFSEGPSKQPRLKDVIFTAGIIRNEDGTATFYTGLSDCQVGKAIIPDPFLEYDN